jgi:hypothetical protein
MQRSTTASMLNNNKPKGGQAMRPLVQLNTSSTNKQQTPALPSVNVCVVR